MFFFFNYAKFVKVFSVLVNLPGSNGVSRHSFLSYNPFYYFHCSYSTFSADTVGYYPKVNNRIIKYELLDLNLSF